MYNCQNIAQKRTAIQRILCIGKEKAFPLYRKSSLQILSVPQKHTVFSSDKAENVVLGCFTACFLHSSRTLRGCRHFTTHGGTPRVPPTPPQQNPEEHHITVLERLHELENKVRIYGYSTIRWGIGIVVLLAAGIYIFRDYLRENVADEVAEVASRSLGDENLVLKANEVTKVVLKDILNDQATMDLVATFLLSILRTEMVTKGALELTWSVLQDPTTQQQINSLCQRTLKYLLENEEIMKLLMIYLKGLIENDQTRESCKHLLNSLSKDEVIQNFMAEFLSDVITSKMVRDNAVLLSKDVTQEVVGDTQIQEETGNAMWNALLYSVTPEWFSGKK